MNGTRYVLGYVLVHVGFRNGTTLTLDSCCYRLLTSGFDQDCFRRILLLGIISIRFRIRIYHPVPTVLHGQVFSLPYLGLDAIDRV